MKPREFAFMCILYMVLIINHQCDRVESTSPNPNGSLPDNCSQADQLKQRTFDDFYMKLEVCRPNISISCLTRPKNPCFKNQATLNAIAFVEGHVGQCLIEANITRQRSLRFYVETKRVLNPNQVGSRGLGSDVHDEKHQRGKCLLKYVCFHNIISSISMDCGSVITGNDGQIGNFTRRRAFWFAPANYSGLVVFSAKIEVTESMRELNISSSKIFIPGIHQREHSQHAHKNSTTPGNANSVGQTSPIKSATAQQNDANQLPENFQRSTSSGAAAGNNPPPSAPNAPPPPAIPSPQPPPPPTAWSNTPPPASTTASEPIATPNTPKPEKRDLNFLTGIGAGNHPSGLGGFL